MQPIFHYFSELHCSRFLKASKSHFKCIKTGILLDLESTTSTTTNYYNYLIYTTRIALN